MYKLEWENDGVDWRYGVYWKYYGEVTGQEIIEASALIYGDSRFDDLRYKLVDFLDIEDINMTQSEVAEIAFQHKAAELSNPYVKTAIVTSEDNKLADLFASFFADSSWEVKLFHDLDEAGNWVDRK